MRWRRVTVWTLLILFAGWTGRVGTQEPALTLNDLGYFERRGVNVLAFSNWYSGEFSDSKLSGIELIHHGVRTATNGDVRLSSTPEQWDAIPQLSDRRIDTAARRVQTELTYAAHDFRYRIDAEAHGEGVLVSVHLAAPLPAALEGRAGFNLEFLPSAYFGKAYLVDGAGGLFPRQPGGPMKKDPTGALEPSPLAAGATLVLAPEDPERRVTIDGRGATVSLYDGRNMAQNGWFVVRSLLPSQKTGKVLEWLVTPNGVPGWTRQPVIAHSQVGYHPTQAKIAVLETDPNDTAPRTVRLLAVAADGRLTERLAAPAAPWGRYLRYDYAHFDFTAVREPGLYVIEFAGERTEPFRIAADVYQHGLWQSTLDTFLPVQMDHMLVNDRYRVWHGASHLDDARQAPVDHVHFDLYAQGPTTDSPYQPGQHIPGLNVGGWYDAGDFDIRTQSQYAVVSTLVLARETFGIDRDQTTVDWRKRFVDLGRPDGVPDILQQIEHGVLALISQYRAVGHAIHGIVEPTINQYTHLGDAVTKTDGLIHNPTLAPGKTSAGESGTPDDRWAFTSRATALDYGSIAALAAASRVLRGYNDELAEECLQTAVRVWDEEHGREPARFRHGNTTGGRLEDEELKAAVELLITTKGARQYADRLNAMWPYVEQQFASSAALAARAMPYMDAAFRQKLTSAVVGYKKGMDAELAKNPFGVPITTGGWGGVGAVLGFGMGNDILHRAFPDIIGPEYTLRALDYVLGTHPASSVSLVSGVGARSKTIAYGSNRADYSFIPGGVVPGIVIVKPDFPELKEDWPFLWFENEYVIGAGASFIYVGNAVNALLHAGRATISQAPEVSPGQGDEQLPPPRELTAEQDHRRLMDLLGITAIRPGADPRNPQAPNAVNYDEAKATPYSELPDPLVLKNGMKVTDAQVWWEKRRPEIVEDFDRELYGRVPRNAPKVTWEVTATAPETVGGIPVITKTLVGHTDNSKYPAISVDIEMTLSTPEDATGPVPVMLEFGFRFPSGAGRPPRPPGAPSDGPTWQEQLVSKGWGYAILYPNSVQADNGAGLTRGIIGLVNEGQPRRLDDWGALRAWAWGASRALDYFETDKAVNARQVGIEGLSRYGKAALVAMAYDSRFAIAFVASSGEGGAKLHRRRFGELVENVAGAGEYHWMAGNFIKYAGPLTANDLPVDAHELIALCAPRPVFISSGSFEVEGGWVDQKGMFLAAVGAGPVYRLLGKEHLGAAEFPPIETALVAGDIAFRQHRGGHTAGPNWPTFLSFAERYIKTAPIKAPKVALTFDDLPAHASLPPGVSRADVAKSILSALQAHKAPPTYGFVNGKALDEEPGHVEVLRLWREAGHLLANHGFTHMDLHANTPEAFQQDVVANEATLRKYMGDEGWRVLRFPYLHEGETLEKRRVVSDFLKRRGYAVAQVTLNFDDWAFSDPYARCVAKNDRAAIDWMKERYLRRAAESLSAGVDSAKRIYGRDIAHVMLLHLGAIQTAMLPRLLDLLAARGFQLVTLPEAQSDSAYAVAVDRPFPAGGTWLDQMMAVRGIPTPAISDDTLTRLDALCR